MTSQGDVLSRETGGKLKKKQMQKKKPFKLLLFFNYSSSVPQSFIIL